MTEEVQTMVDGLVKNAQDAFAQLEDMSQTQVDQIVFAMAKAGYDARNELAEMAVKETKRGNVPDKVTKNIYASKVIWNTLKDMQTVGVLHENKTLGLTEIAEPMGVVAGVTPVTNPTSTVIFNSMIAIKARNPIVFGFHPFSQQSSVKTGEIIRKAAIEAGAPENCIQWIDKPSLEASDALMDHPDVAIVLATGGNSMVKTAYSTGKPALGVGPGNVPVYVDASANLKETVDDLVTSKSFDNGMICAAESTAIVDAKIYDAFKDEMNQHHAYVVPLDQVEAVQNVAINMEKQSANNKIVGHTAQEIADLAGVKVPAGTKVLVTEIGGVGPDYPLSREKLSPVLALVKADTPEQAFEYSEGVLDLGGLGHTAILHSQDQDMIEAFSKAMKAVRILINQPGAQGGIGGLYNNLIPSLTLGCGSWGHNSVSNNVTALNLINIKHVSQRRDNLHLLDDDFA
ncbi:aldehyde dehydrogenase family protein [Lactobacillus selangorensis]|uniref:aldehyde dehydrogenase family protein n=1 Tax=Lactobacillus selangorensis TaxID=81857 RepID=UPI00070B641E|nr:aldehyde dehydrogenase family protein [Lactobacillus selangorensis]